MENLMQDLKEECILFPANVKRTIYQSPNCKYRKTKPKPKKGKVYNMDEKFMYVLDKINPKLREEFNSLRQSSKDRIVKLYNAYHEWTWPITSQQLNHMHKLTKSDLTRLMKLLEVAGLVKNNKNLVSTKTYTWNKTFAASSEVILETLISNREKMTQWEFEYYTADKQRAKQKEKQKVQRKEKIKMDEGKAFSETFIPKEVDPVKEEETVKTEQDETFDDYYEDDDFIMMLNERYSKFREIFPDTNPHQLQKIFLSLVLSEYER